MALLPAEARCGVDEQSERHVCSLSRARGEPASRPCVNLDTTPGDGAQPPRVYPCRATPRTLPRRPRRDRRRWQWRS
eukprot:665469-Prymnesium_polylepis.1